MQIQTINTYLSSACPVTEKVSILRAKLLWSQQQFPSDTFRPSSKIDRIVNWSVLLNVP
jgi:hypothetical protein